MARLPVTCGGTRPRDVFISHLLRMLSLWAVVRREKLFLHGYQAPDTRLAKSLADLSSKLSSAEKKEMDGQ